MGPQKMQETLGFVGNANTPSRRSQARGRVLNDERITARMMLS